MFNNLLKKIGLISVNHELTEYVSNIVTETNMAKDKELYEKLMHHVITMYNYGSIVYDNMSEKSDVDIIAIVDDEIDLSEYTNSIWEYKIDNTDYQFINESKFINMIIDYDVKALEMFWLPQKFILKGNIEKYKHFFKLDKWKLRQVISKASSHAFAKAHKKMTVLEDFDLYRGQKSLFHAVRLLMFGIQIAKYGEIVDYTEANRYWEIISGMKDSPWELYKQTFKPILNQIRSELVVLCPKPVEGSQE